MDIFSYFLAGEMDEQAIEQVIAIYGRGSSNGLKNLLNH